MPKLKINEKGAKAPNSTERSDKRRKEAAKKGLKRLTLGDNYALPRQIAEMKRRIAIVIAEVLRDVKV